MLAASSSVVRGVRHGVYAELLKLVANADNLVVLTGAGVSTESGIPDYRSPAGSYSKGHRPMTHDEFTGDAANRRRYWARSMHGYRPFASKQPNAAHYGVASLEASGVVKELITQNVDGLHQRAGSQDVLELHGNTHSCSCLACGATESRARIQSRLQALNHWLLAERGGARQAAASEMRADGDAELGWLRGARADAFRVPPCEACGGVLKPDVVFFGDLVPRERAARAAAAIEAADALLVCGTSLSTLSAYRLVDACVRKGAPVAILNEGETRAERSGLELLKLEARCGETLRRLAGDLAGCVR